MKFTIEITGDESEEILKYVKKGSVYHWGDFEHLMDDLRDQIVDQIQNKFDGFCYECGELFKGKGNLCKDCMEDYDLPVKECLECGEKAMKGKQLCSECLEPWSIRFHIEENE